MAAVSMSLHSAPPDHTAVSAEALPAADIDAEATTERPERWTPAQRALVAGTIDLHDLAIPAPLHAATVAQIRRAASTTGIFYITNFGVAPGTLAAARAAVTSFFALPEGLKRQASTSAHTLSGRPVGYFARFSAASTPAAAAADSAPSYRELYRFRSATSDPSDGTPWPAAPPGFRAAMEAYAAQTARAADYLAGLLCEGLGLPPDHLVARHGPLLVNGVLTHSPVQRVPPALTAPALQTHSDTNLLNLNVAAAPGARGLQVWCADDGWVTTPAMADAALVNLGDDMETVSDGRYHAAVHRVLTGPRPRGSLITAVEVGADAVLAPAASAGLGEEHKYKVRRQGERLERMVRDFMDGRRGGRGKAEIMVRPDRDLDRARNVYEVGGVEWLGGEPLQDWGHVLADDD